MLDPSYIRSIRDGIINGNIEANNIEALPDGLAGLYDQELFPPTMKWKDRKETLHFFLVFAIAQKEISADFVSNILGEEWCKVLADEKETTEDKRLKKVNDLVQLHSKRFSSAGGGKYRLYHERFRVYVLQKVSEEDIDQFNHKFIELCKTALNLNSEKDIPEKESYALEFISTHFFISAMQGEKECLNKEQAAALKKYAYDQQFWERQVKASKGFEWSKKMLGEMMSWASKFDDEEVIECALNKVDLYHQEQNDAPRIVQLVADGVVEIALDRIGAFGGDDQVSLQRKFILYMLCLMELTLLESKDKEHANSGIEKLLKHLDENLPVNHSILNWGDFFPSYLIFQLTEKWEQLRLDSVILYKRTDERSLEIAKNTEIRHEGLLTLESIHYGPSITANIITSLHLDSRHKIDVINNQIIFQNYRIDKELELLFFETYNDLDSYHQQLFINEISKYLVRFEGTKLIEKCQLIKFKFNNAGQSVFSLLLNSLLPDLFSSRKKDIVLLLNKLLFSLKSSYEEKIKHGSGIFFSSKYTLKLITRIVDEDLSNDIFEGDYYDLGNIVCQDEDFLKQLLLNPLINNNRYYLLSGFIEKYDMNKSFNVLIFLCFEYPKLLIKLLEKNKGQEIIKQIR
jgi:hypothetical protein